MRKRLAILCLLILPCLARAESFDYWWPWIYRNVRLSGTNSTNAVVWITLNSNTVDYVKSHTNLWDAALTNGYLSASNGWALTKIGNYFCLDYDTNAVSDATNAWNWIQANSNSLTYCVNQTGTWDTASSWVSAWSNHVQYMALRTNDWNSAHS